MEVDVPTSRNAPLVIIFQLTTSRGGRPTRTPTKSGLKFFQLTTSRGDRQGIIGMNVKPLNFSTHDLSWRSTVSCEFNPNSFRFSTHDLSWRSTTVNIHCRAAEFFQLTTSRGGRRYAKRSEDTEQIFQLTTSRGGRQILEYIQPQGGIFSTHDLSWRSTGRVSESRTEFMFFNSRPLVEVDSWENGKLKNPIFFNSRPLVEVDKLSFKQFGNHCIFQLTTSRGGRLSLTATNSPFKFFQLTTSRGGRQQNFTINH